MIDQPAVIRRTGKALRGILPKAGILLALVCGPAAANANPVVVSPWGLFARQAYSEMRNELAAMTEEDVRIKVENGFSSVSGDHRFSLPPRGRFASIGEPDFFHVYIPVFLANGSVDLYEKTHGRPSVAIGGLKLPTARIPAEEVASSGEELSRVPLPRGWSAQWYKAQLPAELGAGDLRIRTSYVQPHFPGNISAYLPLRPPEDNVRSQVVFEAADGGSLRYTGLFSLFSPPREKIAFTPRHRGLLQTAWHPAEQF